MAPAIDSPDSNSAAEDDIVVLDRDDVSDYNEYNILPEPTDIQQSVRKWLDPTKYDDNDSEYKKHSSTHLAGTGSWLLESEAYLKWYSSQDDGLLWIRGIPGSGKSVFAAQLVNHLKREHHPVLYFFFRQIIDANHNAEAALRDWLDQVLVFSPLLQVKLKKHLETRNRETLSMAELWSLLRLGLSQLSRAYIVVDALDEMDQNRDLEPFLKSLTDLGKWRPSRVKIIMTSRPIAYIERYLKPANPINVRLEEKMVDLDIATYVRHRLKDSPMETRALIEAAVPGRANGLFLFAKLALNTVLQPGISIETAIEHLPKDLNNIYVDLLKEHSKRTGISDQIQLLILQFVTHAIRPLRLIELAELVSFVHYRDQEDQPDLGSMKNLIRSACGPLLEILPDETVIVVHHSFTEFLNGSTRSNASDYPVLQLGSTHNDLALHCLSYLNYCLEDPQHSKILDSYRSNKLGMLPLFTKYATQFWHIHIQKSALAAHSQSKIHSALDDFLGRTAGSRWVELSDAEGVSKSPLNTAVVLGLTDYIRYLLSNGDKDVVKRNPSYQISPLCYAAKKGYDGIVEMLLQAGVDPNSKESNGETALILATSHSHPQVIKLLIDSGADIFQKVKYHHLASGERYSCDSFYDESPFELAGRLGKEEAMALYFPHIRDSDQVNGALYDAISQKSLATVKMLLQHPLIDVNSKVRQFTPLFTACDKIDANPDTIALLLQAGADPNIVVEYHPANRGEKELKWSTALYCLVDRTHYYDRWWSSRDEYIQTITKCYTSMIAAGANPNQANEEGNTALHNVREASFARLLLAAGADPNTANKYGETPCHVCRSSEVLKLLLEYPKTKLELRDSFGKTPLLSQISLRKTKAAIQLLDAGADATAIDRDGNGVFHHALNILVEHDGINQNIHRRLLEAGANLKLRNNDGCTILHDMFARYSNPDKYSSGFEETLEWLLSNGADVEAKDNEGRTPLFHFIMNFYNKEYEERFGRFLKAGAKLDTLDLKGKSLYHAAVWNPKGCIGAAFGMFSSFNIDPKRVDQDGNTLWHEACLAMGSKYSNHVRSDLAIMTCLNDQGIDLAPPNNEGRTALHIACLSKAYRPVKFNWRISGSDITGSVVAFILKQRRVNIDHRDKHGITALHLASTCCELNTSYLLEAGASVSKATHEGLTALHLAARSRQTNILGMLLQALKTQVPHEQFLEVLNARDCSPSNATALYYACASGNHVSVRLLLEAGATVDTLSLTGSPWQACAVFEQEELNWRKTQQKDKSYSEWKRVQLKPRVDAHGIMLGDKERSVLHENTILPARLDDVVDLLIQYGPSSTRYMEAAILSAAANGFDYTVACLVSKYQTLQRDDVLKLDLKAKLCLQRREAQRNFFNSENLFENTPDGLKLKVDMLMSLREYDLVSEILKPSLFLEMDMVKSGILYDLVHGGFTFLLKKFLTAEVVTRLDDWERRGYDEGNSEPKRPLILEACKSDVPCMELLRFLVEDLGIDTNTAYMSYQRSENSRCLEYLRDQTALHVIATHYRWWQVAEALPYLIQHGSDISARGWGGLTPLHAAVNHVELEYPLNRQVINSLLSHGASPNTADVWNESCLAQAGKNINVFRILIQSGAEITTQLFHSTIRDLNYDILEILLSRMSPNSRYDKTKKKDNDNRLDYDEMYPLHFAAISHESSHTRDFEAQAKIIRLLLDRGADPCAKYPDGNMVMHYIIRSSPFISMFIDLPCFAAALEERDSGGSTLLLSACGKPDTDVHNGFCQILDKSLVELLLDRGADIRVRTNSGETALHHAIKYCGYKFYPEILNILVSRAPDLVNIADNNGHTPLHCAIDCIRYYDTSYEYAANILLSAGANPHLPRNDGKTDIHLLAGSEWRYSEDGAFDSEKRKLFERLVEMGVDVNVPDSSGETPLFYFFRNVNVEQTVPDDPQCGCVDAPDRFRDIMMAKIDERPVLEMFDRAGMDWKVVNKSGETLLHVVATNPETELWPKRAARRFKFLLAKGLDVTVEDEKHRTALDVAASQNATDILDLYSRDQSVAEEEVDGTSIMEDINILWEKDGYQGRAKAIP
ncbi:Tankyrase-2 [Arthrobotrys entomopaga]|nr:Tankyrase-2 [Arthrobotrys entomopaga]